MFVFAGIAVAALAAAVALRVRDAPYLAYQNGYVSAALGGLTARAEAGDGFAAYLIAQSHLDGTAGPVDPRAAVAWFMAAARSGEIRAVAPYLAIVLERAPDADRCRMALVLLELAGRAGDVGALGQHGDLHVIGRCVEANRLRAASYYRAAERRDGRFHTLIDNMSPSLTAAERRELRPHPESFDLDPRQALARFVEEAPALLPDTLR